MEIALRPKYGIKHSQKKKSEKISKGGLFLYAVLFTTAVALILGGLEMLSPQLTNPAGAGIASLWATEKNPYAAYYYYEADKLERYQNYQALHEDLEAGDVVWRVNAGLDYQFYTNITPVTDTTAMPIIVNKYHQLPADYVPPDLVTLASGQKVTAETGQAYQAMAAEARQEGLSLYAASGYRSYELQNRLYQGYLKRDGNNAALVDTYSARPGHSEHQTGRAIDLCGSFGSLNDFVNTPEGPWVRENCYRYGFIVRYQADIVDLTGYKYEPWHISYIGVEHATAMRQLGITCLEEYVVKYIDHQPPAAV